MIWWRGLVFFSFSVVWVPSGGVPQRFEGWMGSRRRILLSKLLKVHVPSILSFRQVRAPSDSRVGSH